MGGVAAAVQQAGGMEDGGRSTDSRQPFSGGSVAPDDGVHPWIGPQVLDAGTARQQQEVEKDVLRSRKGGVGMYRDTATPGDVALFGERGEGHLGTGPAQEIDRGEGLDLFELRRARQGQ